jgi:hypothetical protein
VPEPAAPLLPVPPADPPSPARVPEPVVGPVLDIVPDALVPRFSGAAWPLVPLLTWPADAPMPVELVLLPGVTIVVLAVVGAVVVVAAPVVVVTTRSCVQPAAIAARAAMARGR